MEVLQRTRELLRSLQSSPTRPPVAATIADDQVIGGNGPGVPFEPDAHYFQVRVNEMFLASSRQWFARFDPMVLVVSEFIYDKSVRAVPMVVGPSLLAKYGQKLPSGMILADTRVAGLHPYKGGRLNVAVVLSQVQTVNYARELLKVVESAAGVGLATGLGVYLNLTGVVLDGLEALLGVEATSPVMGFRKEFDPSAGDRFAPSWFALIDQPEGALDPATLWVRNGRLHVGDAADSAKPFRDADFVLYSIGQDAETTELRTLPFYPLWERVVDAATKATNADGDPNWESARADMRSLYQTLTLSPDLTSEQAAALTDRYITQAQALRARGQKITDMDADEPAEDAEARRVRSQIGSILA